VLRSERRIILVLQGLLTRASSKYRCDLVCTGGRAQQASVTSVGDHLAGRIRRATEGPTHAVVTSRKEQPMGLIDSRARQTAHAIWSAWTGGYRLTRLPEEIRPTNADDGWAAQLALADLAGSSYGYKFAATSKAGQAHIGVTHPLPGMLFADFRRDPGAVLPSAELHMRVVEAEFAFLMGRDVPSGAAAAEVLDAVDTMHLAIEVPDSRFEHFERAGEPALLADAACAGWFVLGPEVPDWRELDLRAAETELWINGECAATGRGANVLGDPRAALASMADRLSRFGTALRADQVITTGTTTVPPAIGPGDHVHARFGALGSVSISFAS